MDWSYSNAGLWQRVYEYLGKYNTPDHRLVKVEFSLGLLYHRDHKLPAMVFYPTVKLKFHLRRKSEPYHIPMVSEQWFS